MVEEKKDEIENFKRRLAKFLSESDIGNFYGKLYISCSAGKAVMIETQQTQRVVDLLEN